jgi:cell division protein FtsL
MTTLTRPPEVQKQARASTPPRRVRERRPAGRRYLTLNGAALVALAAIVLTVLGFLYLVQTTRVAGLGYELSRLQRDHDTVEIETARLGYEIAHYESLDTVKQVAIEQLGMSSGGQHRFLDVQRPAQEQLPPPPRETAPPESFWHRIERAALGTGRASSLDQVASASAPAAGPAR